MRKLQKIENDENSKTWCVYMHVNKANGKKYIGQTCQVPETRWVNGLGYRESPRFFNAIQKYGWNNFEHIIVRQGLSLDEANTLEESLIKEFNTTSSENGYNLQSGGLNKLHSDETKAKMKSIHRSHVTEEAKKKMSEAKRGMYIGASNPNAHPVTQLTTDGVFIKYWGCIKDAADCININDVSIRNCCNNKQKTAGGYKWMYKEDYEEWVTNNVL